MGQSGTKRCVIFGAGNSGGAVYSPRSDDLILAADGGYAALRERGIEPDRVIGDFDSLGYVPDGGNVLRFPPEKDAPDMILAIQYGLAQGCRDFALYGATGSRLDHSYANLLALRYLREKGAFGRIYAPDGEIFVLMNERYEFSDRERGKISVFSLSEESRGVTISGLKYALTERRLTAGDWIGLSNEFIGRAGFIRVREGILLIVRNAAGVD